MSIKAGICDCQSLKMSNVLQKIQTIISNKKRDHITNCGLFKTEKLLKKRGFSIFFPKTAFVTTFVPKYQQLAKQSFDMATTSGNHSLTAP